MKTNYRIETFPLCKLIANIELPTFQRNTVWTDEKKKTFISTVISGSPFGSLLLYKENLGRYLLVDGLQRYSTLVKFLDNPMEYVNIIDYCKSDIENLINTLKNKHTLITNYLIAKSQLNNALKENFSLQKKSAQIVNDIVTSLSFLNSDLNILPDVYVLLTSIIQNLEEALDIHNLEIPVILFNGEFDDLPEIFEKMNSNGTQLSKYEIYAAKWCKMSFKLTDVNLLEVVDKKYQDMIDNTGIEIIDYELGQVVKNQEINLFEYCFAIGKLLKQKCKIIFSGKSVKTSDVDSIGFILVSVILTNSAKKMNSLPDYFKNATSEEIIKLKNKILDCAQTVENILANYVISLDDKNLSKYIEYQMTCIIATLFKIRYIKKENSLSFGERPNANHYLSLFKKNMPKRYLYDIIFNYWAGNFDVNMTEELSKSLENNRNLTPILENSWRILLEDWLIAQTQKPMKNIPSENKLFLNYIIRCTILKSKYDGKHFDFEYIISKDRFNKYLSKKNALSALGNVCILPKFETRSKQAKTIYEQIEDKSLVYDIKDDILNDFLYPLKMELDFIKTSETFTYENYQKFIKDRHNFLINKFISVIIK